MVSKIVQTCLSYSKMIPIVTAGASLCSFCSSGSYQNQSGNLKLMAYARALAQESQTYDICIPLGPYISFFSLVLVFGSRPHWFASFLYLNNYGFKCVMFSGLFRYQQYH